MISDELMHVSSQLSKKARERLDLDVLLSRWKALIGECETGYTCGYNDYTNDLCIREILQDFIDAASPALRAYIMEELEPLDERFKRCTRPVGKCLYGDFPPDKFFWFYRIPNVLEDELLEELQTLGFL